MRVGVHLMALPEIVDGRISLESFAEIVHLADAAGVARITTGDGQSGKLECITAQTYMALHSKRAHVGPMVTNGVTRDPGVAAGAVASLDAISDGRAFYVLGRGDAGLRNLGLRQPSVAAAREYFLAVRGLLHDGTAQYQGRELRLRWAAPLDHIKLYLVAEGPQMLELAGEIADGVYIGTGLLPEVVADSIARVHAGAAKVGRDPAELDLWWETRFSVAETWEVAFAAVSEALCSAGNHALRGDPSAKLVPDERRAALATFHDRYSYRAHGTVREGATPNVAAGGRNADIMAELGLTDYFADRFGVIGTPSEVVERLLGLRKIGVDQVHLNAWDRRDLLLLAEQILPALA